MAKCTGILYPMQPKNWTFNQDFVTHWFSNTWPLNIILNRLILPQTTFPSSGLGKWSQVNLMISHSGPQAAKLTSYKYVISDIESNFGVAWNQAHWSGDISVSLINIPKSTTHYRIVCINPHTWIQFVVGLISFDSETKQQNLQISP